MYITVSVYMFDYVSTVISYSLIGVAVFLGKYESLTPADLAGVISKVNKLIFYYDFVRKLYVLIQNSFFSLYLLNGFSKIVDTAVTFAEIAGFTHRQVSPPCTQSRVSLILKLGSYM